MREHSELKAPEDMGPGESKVGRYDDP